MSPLVVRSGAYPHNVEPSVAYEREHFRQAGIDYLFTEPGALTEHKDSLAKCDVLIVGAGAIGPEVIQSLRPGVLLLSCSVGLDHIDLVAARSRHVTISNLPDLCTDEVADHTMALMLALLRKIPDLVTQVRSGLWSRSHLHDIPRLRDLTLGVIGFGRIGRAVAGRAAAFGMRVVTHDAIRLDHLPDAMEFVELSDLCHMADVISCHVPSPPVGESVLGEAEFAMMKPTAVVINTARGSVIDESALLAALLEGRLGGAGLDVLRSEPPGSDHPLLSLPNVIVTPHASGYSDQVVTAIPRLAVAGALAHLETVKAR